MAAADCVLVTSGTATLETLLFKRPMVVAYKMAPLTFHLARYLVKLPFISLPNLLTQECLVPEFIQQAVQPEPMCECLLDYLAYPEKIAHLEHRFLTIHQNLRCQASEAAAAAITRTLCI